MRQYGILNTRIGWTALSKWLEIHQEWHIINIESSAHEFTVYYYIEVEEYE